MHVDLTQSRFARQVALMQKIGDAVQQNHSNLLFLSCFDCNRIFPFRGSGTSCSDKSKRKVFLLTNSPSKCLKKHDIERRVAHL